MASQLSVLLRLPRNVLTWSRNTTKIRSYRMKPPLSYFSILKYRPVYVGHNYRRQQLHSSAYIMKAQNADIDVIIDVTYDEVVNGVQEGTVQMLDVRMPEELQQSGTIGPALNLPVQEMTEAVRLPENDFEEKYGFPKSELSKENLLVYCLAGIRAKAAVKILHQAGYMNAKRYAGSWEEWVEKQQRKKK